jgi:hypothetical protein
MKLNLLPTYVSKEKATRSAFLLGILIFVVCVVGSVFLYTKAHSDLTASQDGIGKMRGEAQHVKETADYADTVISNARPLLRNTGLAEQMIAHNKVYPDLYDEVKPYIPSFFRVNSMSATSGGPSQATVTLVGVLDSYQQYADLMLALLRIKGVQSISRTGFTNTNPFVPAPTPEDQYGTPRKPGQAPIPDDRLRRLEYFQGQGRVTGFEGVGGFGSGQNGIRGAMPTSSQVTVTLVLDRNLQTPDPRATLSAGGQDNVGGPGPGATGGQTPASNPTTTPTTPSSVKGNRKGAKGNGGETGDAE